jgi:hypothetical protein
MPNAQRKPFRGLAAEKVPKSVANYRDSAENNRFCARCSMHQPHNDSCSLVAGFVHRVGLCDFYEPIKKAANAAAA